MLVSIKRVAVAHSNLLMSVAKECWAEVDGERINYFQAGAGPPLLLVHGLLGGSFCWRFNISALAQKHTVYAMDLPGSGTCPAGPATDCSMGCHAQRLLRFIQQTGLNSVSVMGSSFGGGITLLLAAQDEATGSPKIRSLVLAAPVNPWSRFGGGRIRFLRTHVGGGLLRMVLPVSRPVHGIAVRRMYGDTGRIPPGTIEGYGRLVTHPGKARHVLSALRNWQRDIEAMRNAIPKIKIPTLLIWGDRDGAVDPESSKALSERLPNCECRMLLGVGHLSFEEVPEEFNRVALEFLG